MAKKKLLKSKGNFTLKRLHQSGGYGNIYERDYTTISPSPSLTMGQIPIYNSPSFKLSVRGTFNERKKYKYGEWLTNPNSCSDDDNKWTLGCLPLSNNKNKITLKPQSRKLTDFACYGSAVELIKGSILDINAKFPAELFFRDIKLKDTGILRMVSEDSDIRKGQYDEYYIIDNPFKIDIIQQSKPEKSDIPNLRYFCLSEYKYDILDINDNIIVNGSDLKKKNVKMWEVTHMEDNGRCISDGDKIAVISFKDMTGSNVVDILCFYYNNDFLFISDKTGYKIRPNKNIINDFFETLDDFEKVLLNQYTNYTAFFETYTETDYGYLLREERYKYPTTYGNWNLATHGVEYTNYMEDLINLGTTYDNLYTNAIWRDMTHESISNMDLTKKIIKDDEYEIETAKLEKFFNITGRQFDEIKKYADNIKKSNVITYDQEGNTPDYLLSDNLNLLGWESKNILSTISDEYITNPMYGARTIGFTASDANNEFMRRLILNSSNILSKKGTKQAIEDIMALFGFHSVDWLKNYYGNALNENKSLLRKSFKLKEYVYVTEGYNGYDEQKKMNIVLKNDEDIDNFRQNIISLNTENPYEYVEHNIDNYLWMPLVDVTYDGKTRIIPWFDKEKEYAATTYFQDKGGWGKYVGYESYVEMAQEDVLALITSIDQKFTQNIYDDIPTELIPSAGDKNTYNIIRIRCKYVYLPNGRTGPCYFYWDEENSCYISATSDKPIDANEKNTKTINESRFDYTQIMYNDFMLYDNSYTLIENNIEQLLFNIDYIPNSKQTTYVNNVEYNCVIVDNTFYDWKYNHVNKYDYTISKVSFVRNEEDLYKLTYSLLHKDYIYYVYETDKYFKLKNIDRYTTSCGWEELTKEEVDYLNNVVETNKGNNPHIGSYDDGETYLNNFKKFFNGYNFDSVIILDELLSTIHYGFNILRHSDTSKCSFYNSTNKKNYKTYCDLRNENILKPYNLFSNKKEEELSEIDSLSIINSKELHITFDTEYKDFIEEDVLPYIKQVIPATSLFSYSFENIEINGNNSFAAESYEVVCNANTTPVYAVDCV